MTLWFYDPETNTLRYVNVEGNSPLLRALRDVSRPASPRLWVATILGVLQHLGVAVPDPDDPDIEDMDHVGLMFWSDEGEGVFFPLFRQQPEEVDLAVLGMALHQVAQLMIEWPTRWERIPSGDDDDDEVELVWE